MREEMYRDLVDSTRTGIPWEDQLRTSFSSNTVPVPLQHSYSRRNKNSGRHGFKFKWCEGLG